jgi:hypothetical protein
LEVGFDNGNLECYDNVNIVADLKVMKLKQWIEKMKDRQQWRLVVEEATAHPGL